MLQHSKGFCLNMENDMQMRKSCFDGHVKELVSKDLDRLATA